MIDLSICITVKNRSLVETDQGILKLFPKCIESINNACKNIVAELIIVDWESDDWPIEEWVESKFDQDINLITVKSSMGFSRGKGLNIAAGRANGDVFFFCDTDMLVTEDLICEAFHHTSKNKVFYPTVWYEEHPGSITVLKKGGCGNFFIPRWMWSGMSWPEYWSWGFEDFSLKDKFVAKGYNIKTNVIDGYKFTHQWHPDDKDWKNRFCISKDQQVEQERQKTIDKVNKESEAFIKKFNHEINKALAKPKNNGNIGSGIPTIGSINANRNQTRKR
jgi:hypothetical protein